MRTHEEVYEEKKIFTEDSLLPFLQAIDKDIESAEYHTLTRHPYDPEYIIITWKNGHSERVYVTGDSLLALSEDVLKVMK